MCPAWWKISGLRYQDTKWPVHLNVGPISLASAIFPHLNALLAELYKISPYAEGFFSDAHAKIKPLDCKEKRL
jgi:hypothetical protein